MVGPLRISVGSTRRPPGGNWPRNPVVVCGGGAAGLAAAISAARCGAPVLLVEAGSRLGGTVAGALIHTLAGLYDSRGRLLNEGLPRELVQRLMLADPPAAVRKMGRLWVLSVCPKAYQRTVQRWVAAETNLRILTGARVNEVIRRDDRIEELQISQGGSPLRIRPRAVIDATGSAEIARLIDPSLVIDDDARSAGGWVFRIRGIESGALDFPKGLGIVRELREATATGMLPALCAHAWIDAGIWPDEAFVKLMVPVPSDWRDPACRARIEWQAHEAQQAVVDLLRQRPAFRSARVTQTGTLGIRDGGRIRGRYTLTGDDVRSGRKFADSVCRCAWPIEYWDGQRGVSIEHLPSGSYYEIPQRAMQVEGLANFWTAGKCLSADRAAHASARVVGACWAMGQGAGAAAAATAMDTREDWHDAELVRAIPSDRAAAAR